MEPTPVPNVPRTQTNHDPVRGSKKVVAFLVTLVLPNLIGWEQCRFISDRSPLDNILVVQEVSLFRAGFGYP